MTSRKRRRARKGEGGDRVGQRACARSPEIPLFPVRATAQQSEAADCTDGRGIQATGIGVSVGDTRVVRSLVCRSGLPWLAAREARGGSKIRGPEVVPALGRAGSLEDRSHPRIVVGSSVREISPGPEEFCCRRWLLWNAQSVGAHGVNDRAIQRCSASPSGALACARTGPAREFAIRAVRLQVMRDV